MSAAAAQTKIFGIRLGIDPKFLILGLFVVGGLLYWYNSRGDEDSEGTAVNRPAVTATPAVALRPHVTRRSVASNAERNTLRVRPIDPTRGDVDPTLRLDLLNRLQFVKQAQGARSLFDAGPPPMTPEQKALLAHAPIIAPRPLPTNNRPTGNMNLGAMVNIPLKYYGFVKGDKNSANRGLFLDGDNVLVASEGEVLNVHNQRILVVELSGTSARMEDVQIKQGQTLPVVLPVVNP